MGRQLRLVLLLFLSVGIVQLTLASTPRSDDLSSDDNYSNELQGHIDDVPRNVTAAPAVVSKSTEKTIKKPIVNDEILQDLIEASKHSVALADDPRFNKMLPEKMKNQTASQASSSDEEYDDDDDYYDQYYFDDPEPTKKSKTAAKVMSTSSTSTTTTTTTVKPEKKVEMKPIKEEATTTSKPKTQEVQSNDILSDANNDEDNDDDDEDEDDYDNDAEDSDEIANEEETVFSEDVPCPRYCVCARNINSYLVATCSRLDSGTQKFGSDITDLVVTDVGPKYPILLGPDFFVQMGLKHISTVKIINCTIEYLHPEAFNGLDNLYSVNLSNVGLVIIDPDTFVKNKKLRMLTISGNDLSVMSSVHYLLKSSTIEELDLSRNNLGELNVTAFSQLPNIVYIDLSQNNLQKVPEKIFGTTKKIEELDFSYNNLKTLPPRIFHGTTLGILSLKYNSITGDLRFGTSDLQQLDLSFNSITNIHHGMFDKMTGLTNLNLKGNGVTRIQADSFMTLQNLRNIDLSINELDQISSMVFYKNAELDVIHLNDNPKLSQLPTDGFLSYNGVFTVYMLDISNCAIGALGHKTFATMPHLSTLRLAWNNINNLERDTFNGLTKLIDLDLSNNLIKRLDDLMFMNNSDLIKLNLAGNPLQKLSVRLFLPLYRLRELDVSECELETLMADAHYGVANKYMFFDTLRLLNASSNQIKTISDNDVKSFKNLRTFDISHNPLKCDEKFQKFISYVSLNSKLTISKMPSLANIEYDAELSDFLPRVEWSQLAHDVCRHQEGLSPQKKTKKTKLDKRIEEADVKLDEDAMKLLDIMEDSKLKKVQKILKDSKKKKTEMPNEETVDSEEDEKDDDDDLYTDKDDDLNNGGENKDDGDDDDDDDDDDNDDDDDDKNDSDYDDEDNEETSKNVEDKKSHKTINRKVAVKVQDLNDDDKEKELNRWNKFIVNGEDNDDDNVDEELIIERGHVYYSSYQFMIPIVVIAVCLLIILLVIVKLVTVVLRKRGERYRMALLASSKNSIVYQKLSEEIKPPTKEPKQPKVHRYTQINQV